eukprot:4790716-Pleurochrysis_carterae.AAC.4
MPTLNIENESHDKLARKAKARTCMETMQQQGGAPSRWKLRLHVAQGSSEVCDPPFVLVEHHATAAERGDIVEVAERIRHGRRTALGAVRARLGRAAHAPSRPVDLCSRASD